MTRKKGTGNQNSLSARIISMGSAVIGSIKALVVPEKYDKMAGVYYWGEDNNLPSLVINTIAASGTAKRCVSRIHDFVVADGFQADGVGESVVNVTNGMTADELLNQVGWDATYLHGYALRILFNMNGDPGSVYRIPIKAVRVLSNGKYEVNLNRGTPQYRKSDNVIYDAFNPNMSQGDRIRMAKHQVDNLGEQRGQLLWMFDKSIENENYPVPEFIAGLDDIKSDAELQVTELHNITDGFKADVMITTIGVKDNVNKGDDGLTDQARFVKDMQKFKGSKGSKIFWTEAEHKDTLPLVTPIDNRWALDGIDKSRARVPRAVCRHFGIPPILVGFEQPEGLGNTQALINNMKLFGLSVLKIQALISQGFKKIWPEKDWTITTLNLVENIPAEMLQDLTPDERRALVGYKPISDGTTDEKLLSERLGVGGTQSLVDITTNPDLTPEQKLETLRVLFGLNEADAKAIVYGKKEPQSEGGAA